MEVYLNDLSIDGGFPTRESAVHALLNLFVQTRRLSLRAVVTRSIMARAATQYETLYDAIVTAPNTQRALLLSWLGKSGPFADDEHEQIPDDLWWHGNDEVTDQGLGAAARRVRRHEGADAYSFSEGCGGQYNTTPLVVSQGLPGDSIWDALLPNHWTADQLAEAAERAVPEPGDWEEFVVECSRRFESLEIDLENFRSGLGKHPFNSNVVRRGFALLGVLNSVAQGIDDNGGLSAAALELITEHFQGGKPWFSDEEPEDKNVFFFRESGKNAAPIFCSWHGKVKTPQFRLHFQWPVPSGQHKIKVLYFGEKLTKQ